MKSRKGFDLESHSPEHHFVQERVLRALDLREDSVLVERLIRVVAQTMPPEFGARLSAFRRLVRGALFDLEAWGLVRSDRGNVFLAPEREVSLGEAARLGNITLLRRLLAEGAGQVERDEALISAVINNRPAAVRVLLKAGADVRAKDKLFGRTAALYVGRGTSSEITDLLRAAEAGDNGVHPTADTLPLMPGQ